MPPQPSFERINYGVRPAKHVERKMMIEAFRRLEKVAALNTYRYVGFGSPYFPDFVLVHRSLGIETMVSIERELAAEERMKFNRPFQCVEIAMGEAGEVLVELDWLQRSIVWLDYDKTLDLQKVADLKAVVGEAAAGSMVIISVNAAAGENEGRLDRLKAKLEDVFPFDVQDGDLLGGWNTARLFRRVIDDQIRLALDDRNAGLAPALQLQYRQVFNFHYQDGAKMLTVGGVLFDEGNRAHVDACDFGSMGFTSADENPVVIDVPNLTMREIRYLDQQLPCASPADVNAPFLSDQDVSSYCETYRHYPRYADVEV